MSDLRTELDAVLRAVEPGCRRSRWRCTVAGDSGPGDG